MQQPAPYENGAGYFMSCDEVQALLAAFHENMNMTDLFPGHIALVIVWPFFLKRMRFTLNFRWDNI